MLEKTNSDRSIVVTPAGPANTAAAAASVADVAAASVAADAGRTDVRSRRRAQTRVEILDAAWRLSARDGIAGLSLRELAREVGMQAPSLYTYFDSKAAIYDAMFAAGFRELDATFDDLEVEGEPVEVIATAIEAFIAFCRASVPRYQLLFTRAVPDWEPSSEAYAVSVRSLERTAQLLAGLGIERPENLDLLTALTTGMAAQQLANDPDGDRWQRLSRAAAQMFVAHVSSRTPRR
ncbi:MAG: TetR/AcrR family transcriptional regulator [Nitriliruptor sp.]|nr:MAG: TetR/AcrR family transcriptional regulator [Nitriliruptor sp.]